MPVYDPREVIVDDKDIQYSSTGWSSDDQGSRNKKRGQGRIATGNASLSYPFRGSKVRILGTGDTSDSSNENSAWICLLDGKPIPNVSGEKKKDWLLCDWQSSDTPVSSHTVTLNVTHNGENGIRFDRLLYQPDTTYTVHNSTIYVPHSDPAIKYGFDWKRTDDNHIATSGAANLSFSFIGSGLWWYRNVPKESNESISGQSIRISIDQGPFQNMSIGGDYKRRDKSSQNRRLFFQTESLELGQHNLTVLTEGFSNLTLSHLVLANSEIQPSSIISTSATSSSSASAASETSSSKPKSHSNYHSGPMTYKEKMVLGFVIGGLVVFFLVLFTFMFYRRRRIRRMNRPSCEEPAGMPSTSQLFRSGHQASTQPAILSHPYPFARQSPVQLQSNQYQVNPAKRLTTSSSVSSSSTQANSLFPIARLSALPMKGGEPSTPRTYRPYVSRRFRFSNFSSNSRRTTSSSATLLPSPKRSFVSLPDDDQTVVMGRHRDSGVIQCHSRPPEPLPPYDSGR